MVPVLIICYAVEMIAPLSDNIFVATAWWKNIYPSKTNKQKKSVVTAGDAVFHNKTCRTAPANENQPKQ